MRTEDALPSAEDPNFSPKARSIFFHETFSSGLSIRQACAIEAAARAHPNREVYVLFSNPVTDYELKTGCLADLLQFRNVKFVRLHAAEYSKGYEIQSMLLNNVPQSRFRIQHTADILRILTLNKWGGIYLDTDMIVTKSLDGLPLNFVAKESENEIASAVISFAKDEIGSNVTSEIINEVGKEYNPLRWSEIGSRAIDRVLNRRCPKLWHSKEIRIQPITNCKDLYTISYWNTIANYYSDEGDALPSAEDLNFTPKLNSSLFFHKTSYKGELDAQEACSVEAAARAHPQQEIYVLFSAPVPDHELKTGCFAKLHRFPNVKFLRVHIAEYSKGTVVHPILLNDLKESRYPIQHTADILRMLTLNKWGGRSLESDMVVVKSLDELPPNWIVKQGEKFVAPGIMSFSKDEVGTNITNSILEEIFKTYNPNDRFVTGKKAIRRVIERMCPVRIRWEHCPDIGIYKHQLFYSIHKLLMKDYRVRNFQESFSFQWDSLSPSRRTNNSHYLSNEKLARRYCPSIYDQFRKELLGV
ncbi:hypothetical protein PYW07_016888 [Mythimna separata]|uniref:Alpha 1,4-glycosyltransferase domain-containing protein n=1 Tax=Mythimna separata TaxID=271217 RepID=A0AAD7YVL5_MYTSE|nr:hypothetical protein PYW07_016888 [Mythimna separata]